MGILILCLPTWFIFVKVDPGMVETRCVVISGLEYLVLLHTQSLPLLVLALTDETGVELLHPQLGYLLDDAALRLPAVDQQLVELLAALPVLFALLQRPDLQEVMNRSEVD